MTNDEIDREIRISMGWSGAPDEQPARKDIEQIGPGILKLLGEIAKRLPEPVAAFDWQGEQGRILTSAPTPLSVQPLRYFIGRDSAGKPEIGFSELANIMSMLGFKLAVEIGEPKNFLLTIHLKDQP